MRNLLFFLLTALTTYANAQTFINENFTYTNGALTLGSAGTNANVSSNAWTWVSGTGSPISVSSGNLSYTGYASSNTGSKISIVANSTSGEDIRRGFTDKLQTTAATLYASFLLNIPNRTGMNSTGDYFAHFTNVAGTGGGFHGRLLVRTSGTGFNFGLQTNTGLTTTWTSTVYDSMVTYLVVIGYEIVTGANNDIGKLWINPALTMTIPTPDITQVVTVGTEPDGIDAFGLRQSTNTPNADIDGFRYATVWTSAPLPVSMGKFYASLTDEGKSLNWSTLSENNNKGFEIERSNNANEFETIGFVAGNGNSHKLINYQFTDNQPNHSSMVYYRLKQIDFDGKSEYSEVIGLKNDLFTMDISPNPFADQITIQATHSDIPVTAEMIDLNGKVKANGTGFGTMHLDTKDLAEGIYFIRVGQGENTLIKRIIKN